ncbi:hypothetical protein CSUI_008184, partial [Cystoisospora suis]
FRQSSTSAVGKALRRHLLTQAEPQPSTQRETCRHSREGLCDRCKQRRSSSIGPTASRRTTAGARPDGGPRAGPDFVPPLGGATAAAVSRLCGLQLQRSVTTQQVADAFGPALADCLADPQWMDAFVKSLLSHL